MATYVEAMPDINKVLFSGQENISSVEWAALSTPDMGEASVAEFLEGTGWDGNVAGVVGLQLSGDNSRPTAARFAMAGTVERQAEPDPGAEGFRGGAGGLAVRS